MLSRLAISTANVTWAWFLRVPPPPIATGLGRMYTTSSHECHVTSGSSGHVKPHTISPLVHVGPSHELSLHLWRTVNFFNLAHVICCLLFLREFHNYIVSWFDIGFADHWIFIIVFVITTTIVVYTTVVIIWGYRFRYRGLLLLGTDSRVAR